MSVTFSRTGRTLAESKNLKMTFADCASLLSNGITANIVLRNLDLHVRFQIFKICEFVRMRMIAEAKIMKKSSVHIQKFAIERRKSSFSAS